MSDKTFRVFLSKKDTDLIDKVLDFISFKILKITKKQEYDLLRDLLSNICENYLNIGIHIGKSNPDKYSIMGPVLDPGGDLFCRKTGKSVIRLSVHGKNLNNIFFCEECNEFHHSPEIRRLENAE